MPDVGKPMLLNFHNNLVMHLISALSKVVIGLKTLEEAPSIYCPINL